ncbi:peroxiredoxin [Mucilaginibacter sp. PPCGB 2223]|uniref:OsmC family protein n=1 Tax=Mucilaginibacter sp. PPCGB 2223 TaxID=1886027 RepID=UPI000824B521|nr:OsmC family protein [Mucilaginibacter sp. PPCGB 2223]OCX51380.1 peroxiredoxin [Mucilaginibacter sp. PPCGB 2223]
MSLNQVPSASAQAHIGREHYQTTITSAGHTLIADEPETSMGTDLGMSPYSLLLASLGSCTAITLRMYADRKMWVVDGIEVKLDLYRINSETIIERVISFSGNLTDEQRNRLLTIANSCPVHQILTGNIDIKTRLTGA